MQIPRIALAAVLLTQSPPVNPPQVVVPHAQIDGPSTRDAYRTIILDGRQAVSLKPVKWVLLEDAGPLLVLDQGGIKHAFAAVLDPDPNTYKFAQIATGTDNDGDGVPDVDVAVKIVTVEPGEAPAPKPAPDPTPAPDPPTPTPTPAPAPQGPSPKHVSLVTDKSAMTPALAAVMTDPQVRAALKTDGILWHEYDVNSDEAGKVGLTTVVRAAGGPPALVVQDAAGHVLGVGRGQDVASATAIVAYARSLKGTTPILIDPAGGPPPHARHQR